LEKAGAMELKSLGDGFMALFTSASQAIESAVSIQKAIEEHNRSDPERPVSVRIGLNSGDVTQTVGDAHGTAVHAASRIADKAQGGQILVSQIVHDLAGTLGDARVVERGLFWLKGFPERCGCSKSCGGTKTATRPAPPGRSGPLRRLRSTSTRQGPPPQWWDDPVS
jgi:class 3 adenylate cyclase